MLSRPTIPDDPPARGWAAVTQSQLDGMSLEQRRQWNAWFMRTYMGLTSAQVDQQAEHQADHAGHIANGEIRIGQRRT